MKFKKNIYFLVCMSLCLVFINGYVYSQVSPTESVSTQKQKLNGNDSNISVNADKIIVITNETDLKKVLLEKKGKEKPEGLPDATAEKTEDKELSFKNVVLNLKKEMKAKWQQATDWGGFRPWKILFLFIGIVISLLFSKFVRWFIEHYAAKIFASKTKTDIDDMICDALGRPCAMLCNSVGIYFSALPIIFSMSDEIRSLSGRVCLAFCACALAWGVYRMVEVIDRMLTKIAERTDNNLDDLIVAVIRKALKVLIVLIAVLLIGQNILGMNITALLAGAGVVGLAVAFAAQNTIANFFGSIMVILDRPFKVGDRIVVGSHDGVVEHVGFRSSRIRTLSGHLISMPNKSITDSLVENISLRPYIKQVTNLTLVYDTPPEKMERAIEILHELLDNHEGMNEEFPPRIFFNSFNDWSLNIMIIVWYHPGDYWAFQAWNHKTNMEILKRFNTEGIEFAFPTNTTYLAYDPNRKLEISTSHDHNK